LKNSEVEAGPLGFDYEPDFLKASRLEQETNNVIQDV